jgi:hypothetical protein
MDQQLRITNDVDEQDVPDLEFQIRLRMSGHQSGEAIIRLTRRFISKISLIRVYNEAGNVIETHDHKGDFKESP